MQNQAVDDDLFDIDPITTEELTVLGGQPQTETNTFRRETETNT